MDSIGHRRLRLESSFTFLEQAARFHREGLRADPKPIEPDVSRANSTNQSI